MQTPSRELHPDGRAPSKRLSVRQVLKIGDMRQARVVAGADGLDREVRWVHIIDVPDIAPWVSAGDLILTNSYAFSQEPDATAEIIPRLAAKDAAGLTMGVGLFIDEVPPEMIKQADELAFPLITIPWEVRFEDLTWGVMHALLDRDTSVAERIQVAAALFSEAGVREQPLAKLVEALHEVIGYPAAAVGLDGEFIAASTPEFAELVLANSERRLLSLASDERTKAQAVKFDNQRCHLHRVGSSKSVAGYIVVRTPRKMGADDLAVIAVAGAVMRPHMVERQVRLRSTQDEREELLLKLLRGDDETQTWIEQELRALGYPVEGPLFLGLCQVENAEAVSERMYGHRSMRERVMASVYDLSCRYLPSDTVLLARDGTRIPILLSGLTQEEGTTYLTALRDNAEKVLDDAVVTMAVSGPANRLADVPRLKKEAARALVIAQASGRNGQVVSREDLELDALLMSLGEPQAAAQRLVPTMGEFLAADEKSGGQLLATFRTYIDLWGNTEAVARELFVHRNTVKYRMKKVERLLGRSLEDPDDRFVLSIALRLLALRPPSSQ